MIEFNHVSYTYDEHAAKEQARRAKSARRKHAPEPAHVPPADWGRDPLDPWALADVSFTLEDGEFFGIAGHTGSGKSTIVQHMNGLLHPTSGRVLVDGVDIASKKTAAEARAHVGVVFQYPERQLFADTVFNDVAFGPRNRGLSPDDVDARVREALRLVDLDCDEIGQKSPFSLSGGQQRRVAFAGILALEPRTLVLDEPAAGLDPESRENFLELVCRLHREQHLTIVLVSHSMEDLARYCDRILVMERGCVAVLGTPAEVFADEAALKNMGLGVPFPLHLANRLQAEGCPLDGAATESLLDIDGLADAIARTWQARSASAPAHGGETSR